MAGVKEESEIAMPGNNDSTRVTRLRRVAQAEWRHEVLYKITDVLGKEVLFYICTQILAHKAACAGVDAACPSRNYERRISQIKKVKYEYVLNKYNVFFFTLTISPKRHYLDFVALRDKCS